MQQTGTSLYPAAIVHKHTCMKSPPFSDMTSCHWVIGFEMSATDYPVTRRHFPEERSPKSQRCENRETRTFVYLVKCFPGDHPSGFSIDISGSRVSESQV